MEISLKDCQVIYINLDSDKDKKMALLQHLEDLGFNKIARVSGVKNTLKKLGVAISHKKALELALTYSEPVIILEDDVYPTNFKNTIDIPSDSDAYYLGISKWGLSSGKGIKQIVAEKADGKNYRILNMLSAHAILYLNRDYIRFLIKSADFFISIADNQDKGRAETLKYWNVYCNQHPTFAQSGRYMAETTFSMPSRQTSTRHNIFLQN
jgi:hypothetical protein